MSTSAYPPSYGSSDILSKSKGQSAPSGVPQPANDGRFDFATAPKYPDLWATILFVANFLCFAALSFVGIAHLSSTPAPVGSANTANGSTPIVNLSQSEQSIFITVLVVFTIIAAILSGAYVALMKTIPKQLITFSFIASIVLTFGLAAFFIVLGLWLGGAIYIIIGFIYVLCYIFWRKYIPFTAAILESVVQIGNKYPASYLFAFLSLIIGLVFQIWWSAGVVGVSGKFQNSGSLVNLLVVYLVFTLYWIGQVLRNTLHVTISGTVASYFFLEGTSAMPSNPTLQAAKRAFTTSFGPIAFGSLIVALLQTVRWLLRQAARDGSILALILGCFVGCIENLVEYFNTYAYIQVAIYGKSFCNAAKDTWNLIKSTGFEMIINDSLIGAVLNIAIFLVGLVVGAGAYLSLHFAFSQAQRDILGGYMILLAFIEFIIGAVMMSIVSMYIQSGVQTMYVCLAEDPAAIARTKPQLYEKFKQTYPSYHWRI